jgi:hypothetical protein
MAVLYLIGSVALGVFAYNLQRPVYHPPPPPGEIYAVVFVQDPAAHLSLSADIYPNKPWYDSLNVVVGHVPRSQAGWLLVVECPGRAPQPHAASLYSAITLQAQPAHSLVTVKSGMGNKANMLLGCVQAPKSTAGTPGYSTDLANVSVAALQLDDGMVGAAGLPVLYAWPSNPGSQIPTLLQVFPSADCPSAAPVSTASASPVAPASTTSSDGSTAPSAAPATPANPRCLNLASAEAKITQYAVPVSESTTETLHSVDYKNYQISMYPTGNTPIENNGLEDIIWQAPSAQDPNFAATNATTQLAGQKSLFISGVLWGIVGGAAVACLDHLYEAYRERKGKPPGRQVPL